MHASVVPACRACFTVQECHKGYIGMSTCARCGVLALNSMPLPINAAERAAERAGG